jgi:hypothetical protein
LFILAEDTTSPKGLVFFEQQVSENWFVKGIFYPNKDRNDACFAVRDYRDAVRERTIVVSRPRYMPGPLIGPPVPPYAVAGW